MNDSLDYGLWWLLDMKRRCYYFEVSFAQRSVVTIVKPPLQGGELFVGEADRIYRCIQNREQR